MPNTQKVLCNWGIKLKHSSAAYIQTFISADGILPGFCWLTSAFIYKFSIGYGLTIFKYHHIAKPKAVVRLCWYRSKEMAEQAYQQRCANKYLYCSLHKKTLQPPNTITVQTRYKKILPS